MTKRKKKPEAKPQFYRLDNILKYNALYNVIFGGRSNGKSYAVQERILTKYVESGYTAQGAIIRRWRDDFVGKRGVQMFANHVSNGLISALTGGLWTDVYYYRSSWFLARYEEGELIKDEKPFCYGFSISGMEHDKSTSYPNVKTILFDEFLTRTSYLPDEFVLFCNVLSTIIRHRNDVEIFMCGNTVNKYCPYFSEMGLSHIKDMHEGTIDLYRYGDSGLTVAVEYCENNVSKASSSYFAFDNPKLSMITGSAWEIDIYPHCPVKYRPKDVIFTYFIIFDNEVLQCEIVHLDNIRFTFIHRKTTPIRNPDKDVIYQPDYDPRINYQRRINKPVLPVHRAIWEYYQSDRVYYQDNETGEIVRNYLQWCETC